jgi:osmotically-inducible protein OsmY
MMALLMAEDVSATAVRVDTIDGKVTLHGTVSSADEKARAERAAQGVKGVHEVRNLLQVVEKPRQESAAVADEAVSAAAGEQQDERLQDAVEKRLKAREDLADASIDVEVADGVARLTGTVRSQSDRLTALTLARTTDGVRSVIGDLDVKAQ